MEEDQNNQPGAWKIIGTLALGMYVSTLKAISIRKLSNASGRMPQMVG